MGMLLRRHYKTPAVVEPTAVLDKTEPEKAAEKQAEKVEEEPLKELSGESVAENLTKTDINRMSKNDLVAMATEQGIKNANETSGAELKKQLIEKFGL